MWTLMRKLGERWGSIIGDYTLFSPSRLRHGAEWRTSRTWWGRKPISTSHILPSRIQISLHGTIDKGLRTNRCAIEYEFPFSTINGPNNGLHIENLRLRISSQILLAEAPKVLQMYYEYPKGAQRGRRHISQLILNPAVEPIINNILEKHLDEVSIIFLWKICSSNSSSRSFPDRSMTNASFFFSVNWKNIIFIGSLDARSFVAFVHVSPHTLAPCQSKYKSINLFNKSEIPVPVASIVVICPLHTVRYQNWKIRIRILLGFS